MITTKSGNYFESKIRREGVLENGQQAKLNEMYVVRADTFTETESRITSYAGQYFQGEFEVLTEVKAKYKEIFFSDNAEDEIFYKVCVAFITLDEVSGRERKSKVFYLVQGSSVESARKNVEEVMNGTMTDYKIVSLAETNIVDYIE